MAKYLVDVNLPRYFSLWNNRDYKYVVSINDEMKDKYKLVIVYEDHLEGIG